MELFPALKIFLALIIFLVVSLVPLALSGPIAALVLVSAAKKKKLSRFHLFGLVIINVLLLVFIFGLRGYAMFGPGDVAVCITPLAIVITVTILNASKEEVLQFVGDDLQQQRYYDIGKTLLPALQLMILLFSCLLSVSGGYIGDIF